MKAYLQVAAQLQLTLDSLCQNRLPDETTNSVYKGFFNVKQKSAFNTHSERMHYPVKLVSAITTPMEYAPMTTKSCSTDPAARLQVEHETGFEPATSCLYGM
jgi:hypothetical protein